MSSAPRWILLALSIVLAACKTLPPATSSCTRDEAVLMTLDYQAFDQDLTPGGWRKVAAMPGCKRAAARMISLWREAHGGMLPTADLWILWWHEGQALASAGDYQAAIQRMRKARTFHDDTPPPRETPADDVAAWRAGIVVRDAWEEATLAFLRRDRAAFDKARARMLAVPEPAGFAETAAQFREKTGASMAWPLNVENVEQMRACFDRLYGVECREHKAP